ncbi:MAG TPA: aspartate carbamoyltransferase catalytic subunit [Terriglobales bacterium]|jgi:aspartate carbamoyltransferase catalytic subunit
MPPTTPTRRREDRLPHFAPGSLLDTASLSRAEIMELLAESKKYAVPRSTRLLATAPGKTVALLFYEASTRTRVSFEFAAKSIGAVTTIVTANVSSIEKGESLIDTGLTLQSLGTDCIVIRHPNAGAPHTLARQLRIPVINAGDGAHEHPTQALLDAFTLLQHRRSLEGMRMVIVGDILHSRVTRSNLHLLVKLGAYVTLCGPESLLPNGFEDVVDEMYRPQVRIMRDFDHALEDADAVMMLRIQKERLAGLQIDLAAFMREYQLTAERKQRAKRDLIVMHPGPMIRGLEIASEVADGIGSVILEQVRNGVFVRRAVLARALAEQKD